jgi:dolichol kinase
MRESEESSFSGLPFYALGISLAGFFYSDSVALIAICFLIFSDPIASIFGVLYGKEMILPNRSLVGTLANFFSCYVITLIFIFPLNLNTMDMLIFTSACAIIGSVSELLGSFNIDDNLAIPVVSGAGISLVNAFMDVL